jgi:hypothetical protein
LWRKELTDKDFVSGCGYRAHMSDKYFALLSWYSLLPELSGMRIDIHTYNS